MRQDEPVIGWRLWRARDGVLYSWLAADAWAPGENVAGCLAVAKDACTHPPGREECGCGFWGLTSPGACLVLARAPNQRRGRSSSGRTVLGLIRGWGEVALHGREGFRAERAAPVLLFSDAAGPATAAPMRWWDREGARTLQLAADRYGVPLLSLRAALEHGVLEEMGVTRSAIDEVAEIVRPSPRWPAREFPPGLYGGEKTWRPV